MYNKSWCSCCKTCTHFMPEMQSLFHSSGSALTTLPAAAPAGDALMQQEVMQQAAGPRTGANHDPGNHHVSFAGAVNRLSALTILLCAAPAPNASVQQENLFAFIDSVMQQAAPPSADARAAAAAASASAPQPAPQSPAAAQQTESAIKDERCAAARASTPYHTSALPY